MNMISIVTPCWNESENVEELYERIRETLKNLSYEYEHIFIDNASTDGTAEILKDIASRDKRVKIIINARNFGHIRSPYYGLLQASGSAVIILASDLHQV